MNTTRQAVRIRFKGGPLHRRRGRTPDTPAYRDADGIRLATDHGRDLIRANGKLGFTAPIYVLDEDRRTYVWLADLLTGYRTERIKALLEQAAEHPERAEQIEAEIRELERLSADRAESAA